MAIELDYTRPITVHTVNGLPVTIDYFVVAHTGDIQRQPLLQDNSGLEAMVKALTLTQGHPRTNQFDVVGIDAEVQEHILDQKLREHYKDVNGYYPKGSDHRIALRAITDHLRQVDTPPLQVVA